MTERKGGWMPPTMSPGALKAFAHPLRMELYSRLQDAGPATASQLGRALGESSGQTSYHLRQLERHGLVEDDPAHTGGRERWWRAVGFNMDSLDLLRDPATATSARAVLTRTIGERTAALTAWAAVLDAQDEVWTGALSSTTVVLTPEEFGEVTQALMDLLEERLEPARGREEAGELPDGARRVRFHLDAFPLAGPGAGPATPSA
jgi:DNA-binding transcriptional ArsR family regulator